MYDEFIIPSIHTSWRPLIRQALGTMDQAYLNALSERPTWLPGKLKLFNAFSLALEDTQYILFGESPYPRAGSANGYAFWDAAVEEIWSG